MRDHWEVVDRRELLDASPWLKVYAETVRLEDEKTLVPNFYHVDIPAYAIVFAVTTDQRVPMIEEYKHAVGRRILGLPAGYIEEGEPPMESAQRELREETGLAAEHWQTIGVFTVDGNRGCGQAHAFLALEAYPVAEPDPRDLGHQTIHFFEMDHLRKLWLSGEITMLPTTAVIGLGLAHIGK